SGTAVLSGTNTYTGATTLNGGIVQLAGGSNRLPTTTSLTTSGGTLDVNGQNQQIALLLGTGGAVINSSTADATLTISTGTASAGDLDNMFSVAGGGGWTGHGSIVSNRSITLSGTAGGVIRVGYATSPNFSTFTINGQISGSGGLTTVDGGTVILSNSTNNWQG